MRKRWYQPNLKPAPCFPYIPYLGIPRAKLYETHHVSLRQIVEKDMRNIEKQLTFVAEKFVSQILVMLTSCDMVVTGKYDKTQKHK